MNIHVQLFMALVFFSYNSTLAYSGQEVMQKAGKSLEQRRYDEAWKELSNGIGSLDSSTRDNAMFVLSNIFHNDAALYRKFHESAVVALEDYYALLLKDKSKKRSALAPLAAANLAITSGDCKKALGYAARIDNSKSDKFILPNKTFIETICKSKKGVKISELAAKAGGSIDIDLSIAAYGMRHGQIKESIDLLNKKSITVERVLKDASSSGIGEYISILTAQNKIDDALKFVSTADLSKHWLKEESKDGRVIFFYSPNLLSNLADLYANAAKFYSSKIPPGSKYEGLSSYLAAERSFFDKNYTETVKTMESIVGKGKLPPRLDERGTVILKMAKSRIGKASDVDKLALDIANQSPDKLDTWSDVAMSCEILGSKCEKFSQLASTKVDTVDIKRGKPLMIELGKLMYRVDKHQKSIALLEMARDKANKNKIEYNDPLMLTSLANAYRRSKSFSEHLEIFFEMSKYYPVVRQIQDAVQGVYSVEQKSAGDVKIF